MTISAEQTALDGGQSTVLTCTADNGIPDAHNLTWIKNGRTLASGRGKSLTYNILYSSQDPYGMYTCLVESLYSTEMTSILIQEKGTECAATGESKGSSGTENNVGAIIGAFVGGLAAGIAIFGVGLCVCIW